MLKGGITLVVVPLKEMVHDQVTKHQTQQGLNVERLFTSEEAKRKEGVYALDRLQELENEFAEGERPGTPIVLFTTAELIGPDKERADESLQRLSKAGVLDIVYDEFDYAFDSSPKFRPGYKEVLLKLIENCADSNFTLLSATVNKDSLRELLPVRSNIRNLPQLFLEERPISDSLCFRVERKTTKLDQVGKFRRALASPPS